MLFRGLLKLKKQSLTARQHLEHDGLRRDCPASAESGRIASQNKRLARERCVSNTSIVCIRITFSPARGRLQSGG